MSCTTSYPNSVIDEEEEEKEMNFHREWYLHNRKYEVFLSFRGEDTRASFTSHLYAALHNAGILVFKDDESLPRGNQISPSLRLAIEESRISVVVFSRNYAESRWCLKELEKIMECHRTTGHVVVPVFYDVDPSEVRHQTGHFGNAFENLLKRILKEEDEHGAVMGWREALCEAARISMVADLYFSGEKPMMFADKIDLLTIGGRDFVRLLASQGL